jgi:hypothetical protein
MKWVGHVAVWKGFAGGNLMERYNLEYLGIDDRIIFKCIFKKWYVARIGIMTGVEGL